MNKILRETNCSEPPLSPHLQILMTASWVKNRDENDALKIRKILRGKNCKTVYALEIVLRITINETRNDDSMAS